MTELSLPSAPLLLGFHVGDAINHKTTGYGGHPMNVHVHLRSPPPWRNRWQRPGSGSRRR